MILVIGVDSVTLGANDIRLTFSARSETATESPEVVSAIAGGSLSVVVGLLVVISGDMEPSIMIEPRDSLGSSFVRLFLTSPDFRPGFDALTMLSSKIVI